MAQERLSFSESELAELHGIPRKTLERWRKHKSGPPWIRIGPRLIRYPTGELNRWLATRVRGGNAEAANQ
jgi:predicted DNA-binding transcriptional regulator AlpA